VADEVGAPVLLVGQDYGGAVITVAGARMRNAVGLVYVSGYALAEGESAVDINGRFPAGRLGPALRPATFSTGADRPAIELYLKREAFREAFAADLPERVATVLAAGQRPITAAALEERAPAAAWRTLPSWYLVATADQALHPEAQRVMAKRAGATTVEVDASHAAPLSRPAEVAQLVGNAVADRHRRRP
jgi:pimeloyl-ACP methyl ester carboxylesterase